MKKIRFYKENSKWYADVPQHTKAENVMVLGSDAFLDCLSWYLSAKNEKRVDEIMITIVDGKPDKYLFHLLRYAHNGYGANYMIISSHEGEKFKMCVDKLWLCNVMHTVCREHPKDIYITEIS